MKTILFLCIENSCRSQIAEAFANAYSYSANKIISAGSNPSGEVNPTAIKLMGKIGHNISDHSSKSVNEIKEEIDILISMGCGDSCPQLSAKKRLEWDIPDPKKMKEDEFMEVIKLIDKKVKKFIENLSES
mgnify:FL=1